MAKSGILGRSDSRTYSRHGKNFSPHVHRPANQSLGATTTGIATGFKVRAR